VILAQLEEHCHLVLDAIPENRRHADLLGALLPVAVVLDDVLRLGTQRDGDMHRTLENAIYQLVVLGRHLAPCGVAVSAALGNVALHIQQAAFAGPGMRQRIDDQELHAILLRYVDGFQLACRAEGGLQVDGQVLPHSHAVDHGTDIQGAGLVLRVDHTQLFPDFCISHTGMCRTDQSIPQQQ